ncbi:MAG: hypothetical protein ABSF26_11945 [Thermoguttaceae bacterium]
MRLLVTSFAIVLALAGFGPTRTMAKEPGGGQSRGQRGGGQQGVEQHVTGSTGSHHEAGPNLGATSEAGTSQHPSTERRVDPQRAVGAGGVASPDSWRYRSENGRWWYWTPQNRWMWYGDDGRWMDYSADTNSGAANTYTVERPVVAGPLPETNFSGGPIKITNPATNKVTVSYTLDGNAYTIPPGYDQDLREDRAWVIQFSRGANLERARYGLQSGLYSFTSTDNGWELYRSELP